MYEAARLSGVKRVVFASSNHAVGNYPLRQDPYKAIYDGRIGEVRRPFPPITHEMLRPDSYYGVSKAFGESLGSFFHDEYGISIICLRIGWVMTPDDPAFSPAALSLWLSHRGRGSTDPEEHRCAALGRIRGRERGIGQFAEHLGHRDYTAGSGVRAAGRGG